MANKRLLLREKCPPWSLGVKGSVTLGFKTKITFIGQEESFGSKEFTLGFFKI